MSLDYNNVVRDGFIAGLGAVPEVGSLCAWLCTELWPASGSNPMDDLEAKLKEITVKIEDEVWISRLKGLLDELRVTLKKVGNPQSLDDKKEALNLLYSDSSKYYDYFVNPTLAGGDDNQPQNTVALLVAFGTIRLSALVERVRNYHDLVGDDPTTPPVNELRDNLGKLSEKVANDRARALEWRQQQISAPETTGTDIGNFKKYHNWKVSDALDSSFYQEFGAEDGTDDRDDTSVVEPQVIQYVNTRRFSLSTENGGYASNLDQLLDAARFWKYSDPLVPLVTTPGSRYWCNLIGAAGRTGNWFNHKSLYIQHGDITCINWWWDAGALKGIQVFYGGVPSAVHGKAVSSSGSLTIDPSSDGFTYMGSTGGDWVQRFTVDINSRISQGWPIAGRHDCATVWQLQIKPTLSPGDARLAYIAGITNGDVICQLKVVWKTGETYTTDLPTEHSADAIRDGFW